MSEQSGARVWETPPQIREHIEAYLKDPEAAHLWDSGQPGAKGLLRTLLLTATGRKSGELRHTPLAYGKSGDDYVVIASKAGFPSHPAWYLNLLAQPEAEIRVGAERMRVRARTAEGEERDRLWAMMRDGYPPFDDYQARAGRREIPVVVLEPQR